MLVFCLEIILSSIVSSINLPTFYWIFFIGEKYCLHIMGFLSLSIFTMFISFMYFMSFVKTCFSVLSIRGNTYHLCLFPNFNQNPKASQIYMLFAADFFQMCFKLRVFEAMLIDITNKLPNISAMIYQSS
jgi:hypothetical protein